MICILKLTFGAYGKHKRKDNTLLHRHSHSWGWWGFFYFYQQERETHLLGHGLAGPQLPPGFPLGRLCLPLPPQLLGSCPLGFLLLGAQLHEPLARTGPAPCLLWSHKSSEACSCPAKQCCPCWNYSKRNLQTLSNAPPVCTRPQHHYFSSPQRFKPILSAEA